MELVQEVISIVREVADDIFGRPFDIHEKGSICNIVTTSDTAVQKALVERFSRLLADAGFLAEEDDLSVDSRPTEWLWIIDPIDGTQNFSRHIEACCVSVGLLKDNEPYLGVVYMPYSGDVYSAVRGEGAYKNGRPIHVSQRPFEDSLLCMALSLYRKEYAEITADILLDAFTKVNDTRRFGSCAYELCQMAEGKVELFFELRLFPWDYAGSYVILTEAGGSLSTLNGEPVSFHHACPLIAGNSEDNRKRLTELVSRHLPKVPYRI